MRRKIDARWVESMVEGERKGSVSNDAKSSKRSASRKRKIPRALITGWD